MASAQEMVERYVSQRNVHHMRGAGRIYPVDPAAVTRFKSIVCEGVGNVNQEQKQEKELTAAELWAAYRDLYIGKKRTVDQVARQICNLAERHSDCWDLVPAGELAAAYDLLLQHLLDAGFDEAARWPVPPLVDPVRVSA